MIIAQLSDPHLAYAGEGTPYAGEAALTRAVEHLMRLPAAPNLVIVTGDLADGGRADEYSRVRQILSALTMPVYVVPGNHDTREPLLRAFGKQGVQTLAGFVQYVVDAEPFRLIALDTLLEGQAAGSLNAAQLAWLDARLSEARNRPTLLLMHHPPYSVGIPALDEIGLQTSRLFGELVARYSQIEGIAAGHVHTLTSRRYYGTVAWTCGATQHHLFPDLGREVGWAARTETPSVLLHVWRPQTGLVTHTSHIGGDAPFVLLHDGKQWLG